MDGVLVNSYEELEPGVVKAFRESTDQNRPKIYAIGRLTWPMKTESDQAHESLTWLDSQSDKSVVYVSFGSWGWLTPEQITELALGPFITHCGWGSSLEGITNVVPMIAIPLHAEQRMNAVLPTDDAKVCLRPNKCEQTGLSLRDEIVKVKSLMEGEEMEKVRERSAEMMEAAVGTLLEGGLSYKAMEEVVQFLKKDVV
ncbi:hypothetical protein LUZ60_010081 [Juncus effusus]|nr:hypothetical protein LUZ60_010081 [Juncus effusus]